MAYDDRVILDEVSFMVNPGETKIVMGGSGTGKSTILKLVLGLIKPQVGRILIDGEDVTNMSEAELTEVRKKIGDKKYAEAVKEFEAALQDKPGDKDATEALQKAKTLAKKK